jgi:superkiller protein 3
MRSPILRNLWIVSFALVLLSPLSVGAQTIDQLRQQSTAAYEAKQYLRMIELLQKILEIDPNNSLSYYQLGVVFQEQQKLDEAIDAYKKAIALDPQYADAYNNLGVALKDQKKLDPAIDAYRKAIALNPQDATAYNNLGNVLSDQKKLDEAIDAYKKAIALNPQYVAAYNNLGIALYDQKKDEAIDAFKKAIALNPQYATAYYNLGIALYDQKKLDEAIDAFKKAIALNPQYAAAYNNLGIALSDQKKLDEAIDAYRKSLSLPDDTSGFSRTPHTLAHNNLGRLLKEQGDLEAAEQEFLASLKIDPQFEFAKNNLEEVRQLRQKPIVLAFTTTQYLKPTDPETRVRRATVIITPIYSPEGRGAEGTGFIIKRQGDTLWILTNRHVVMDAWERSIPRVTEKPEIQLYLGDKRPNERIQPIVGQVLHHTDAKDELDLAIIQVTAPGLPPDIQPLPFNLSPNTGSLISAIGHPKAEEWAKGEGKLLDIDSQRLILKINFDKGNSGGPILDQNNRVIGVADKMTDQTTGFAFPMQRVLQQLQTWGVSLP